MSDETSEPIERERIALDVVGVSSDGTRKLLYYAEGDSHTLFREVDWIAEAEICGVKAIVFENVRAA